jgi:hypothetical protein
MFHLVCFGWLLFRAETIGQVGELSALIATDFTITPLAKTMFGMLLFYAGPLIVYELWQERQPRTLELLERHWLARASAYAYAMTLMIYFPPPVASEFIYFQF